MAETIFTQKKALILNYLGFIPMRSVQDMYYRQNQGCFQQIHISDVYLDSNLCFEALERLSKDGFTVRLILNRPIKPQEAEPNSISIENNLRLITRTGFEISNMKIAIWETILETLENPF